MTTVVITDPIVEMTDLVIRRRDGTITPLTIRVGRPFYNDEHAHWSCATEAGELLRGNLTHGETALQALGLALEFMRRRIDAALEIDRVALHFASDVDGEPLSREIVRSLLGALTPPKAP